MRAEEEIEGPVAEVNDTKIGQPDGDVNLDPKNGTYHYHAEKKAGDICASPRKRIVSFSEIDKIGDNKRWFESRPFVPLENQKTTIKGSQSYSLFNREFYFPRHQTDEFKKLVLTWTFVTLLALVVCIAALAIDWGVNCTFYAVFGLSVSLFLEPYSDGDVPVGHLIGAFIAFALSCALFALMAGYLVVFIAPMAEGSGIPDVKSYLNGVYLKGLFTVPTAIAKSCGCAFSIGSGLIAGREGPIIHVGAIIGSGISQGASNMFGCRLPDGLNKHFRSAEWKRDFAVMGSAFGVAAAFVAPMGGVLFAIEEGATVWRQQLTFLTMYGAVVTAFFTSLIKGYINNGSESPIIPEVLFGSYRDHSDDIVFRARDFPFVLLVAVLGGVVGSAFAHCQSIIMPLRKKYIRSSKINTLLEIVLVSLIISSVRFWVPFVLGKCVDDSSFFDSQGDKNEIDRVPNPIPFHCSEDETNDLGIMFWLPSEHMLKWVLHTEGYSHISSAYLAYSFLFYFIGACLTFGMAVPSGLFIPAFIIGGTYGRLVGQLAASTTGNYDLITSYAFLGSASALGGITRVSISVAMIALESTQNFNTSLYCFFVVIIAKLIADSFNLGIYDLVIEQKDIPFLVDDLGHGAYQLTMDVVMTPVQTTTKHQKLDKSIKRASKKSLLLEEPDERRGMATILSIDTLRSIIRILENNPGEFEFLAGNKEGGIEGTIERLVIFRLMEHQLVGVDAPLLHPSSVDSAWPNLRDHISPRKEGEIIAQISEDFDAMTTVLDLRPYIDREPAIVLDSGSMRKAHAHFRNGERNVLVASPKSVNIIGVVKRHDILPGVLESLLRAKKKHLRKLESKKPNHRSHGSICIESTILEEEEDDNDDDKDKEVPNDLLVAKGIELTPHNLPADGLSMESSQHTTTDDSDSNEVISLSPFEPCFYELLRGYLKEKAVLAKEPTKYVQAAKPVHKRTYSF